MELGSIYRYIVNNKITTIFVYEVSEQQFVPEGLQTCALAVNLEDSSDIRRIPHYYWQYWNKVE